MEGLICCLLPAWVLKWFQFSQKIVSHHVGIEWLKCDIAVDKSGCLEICFYCSCLPSLSGPCGQIRIELYPIDRWVGTGIPSPPCLPGLKKSCLNPTERRCCLRFIIPRLLIALSLYNSMAVSVWAPPPTERQTLLFAHGSRGLWLTISKPVWVNIWYIPWTNYLSECTLGLLSNPRPFPSGSQAGRHPLGSSACSHDGETFPKAFPVLLASGHALTSFPSCVFHKHTRGPKSSKGRRCPFVNMLDWG